MLASLVVMVIAGLIPLNVHAQITDTEKLIGYVNDYRQSKKIAKLNPDPILMNSAQAQADYLAKSYDINKGGDGTVGDRGTLPTDRAFQRGYSLYGRSDIVELWIVLNKAYPLENVLTNDWWRTKANQNNLLDGWGITHTDIGVGIAARDTLVFYVIDIGVRLDSPNTIYITNEAGSVIGYVPLTTSTPNPDGSVVHTVQAGETLQIIALSYGVDVKTILDLNNMKSSNMIYPDQKIIIQNPSGTPGAEKATPGEPTATHTTAPTFTARPPSTVTPVPTLKPPTPTLSPTPKPESQNPISIGMIGLIAVIAGIVILVVFFMINRNR